MKAQFIALFIAIQSLGITAYGQAGDVGKNTLNETLYQRDLQRNSLQRDWQLQYGDFRPSHQHPRAHFVYGIIDACDSQFVGKSTVTFHLRYLWGEPGGVAHNCFVVFTNRASSTLEEIKDGKKVNTDLSAFSNGATIEFIPLENPIFVQNATLKNVESAETSKSPPADGNYDYVYYSNCMLVVKPGPEKRRVMLDADCSPTDKPKSTAPTSFHIHVATPLPSNADVLDKHTH